MHFVRFLAELAVGMILARLVPVVYSGRAIGSWSDPPAPDAVMYAVAIAALVIAAWRAQRRMTRDHA